MFTRIETYNNGTLSQVTDLSSTDVVTWDGNKVEISRRPATATELVPIVVDPTPAAQVNTATLAVALADAKAFPTLATLQAAIVALGESIAPLT